MAESVFMDRKTYYEETEAYFCCTPRSFSLPRAATGSRHLGRIHGGRGGSASSDHGAGGLNCGGVGGSASSDHGAGGLDCYGVTLAHVARSASDAPQGGNGSQIPLFRRFVVLV